MVFLPLISYGWIRLNNERLWILRKDFDEIREVDAGRGDGAPDGLG